MVTTRSRRTAGVSCHILDLPIELLLAVACEVRALTDRASLCLALPPLGLAAQRNLKQYQDVLMSVALRLARLDVNAKQALLNEVLLRFYVADRRATDDGRLWLNAACAGVGSKLEVQAKVYAPGEAFGHVTTEWVLFENDEQFARLLLKKEVGGQQAVMHFEGDKGTERVVRLVKEDGRVMHYEGDKGAERVVLVDFPGGGALHYEGANGAERLVRVVHVSGVVQHFEGERGEERKVRAVRPDGRELHYKGDKDKERVMRMLHPNGRVDHFEGDKRAERVVRVVLPDSTALHYEGEKRAERLVRAVQLDGIVAHYKGGKGAERLVRAVRLDGSELHYKGEQGAERHVCLVHATGRVERI